MGDNKKVPAGARAGRDKEGRELKVISLQQWILAHEPDTLKQPVTEFTQISHCWNKAVVSCLQIHTHVYIYY